MEIRQDLPQFEEAKSLLIVSGETKAKYFIAYDGYIDLFGEFAVADPTMELREDYVRDSKRGKPGAIPEEYKQYVQQSLFKRISEETRLIFEQHKIQDTYVFCVAFMLRELVNNLYPEVRESIRSEFPKDLHYHHPFELLELIKEKREQLAEKTDLTSIGF